MPPKSPTGNALPGVEPTDHLRGAEHARVTLIEYGDFECPTCRMVEPALALLLESHPQRLRLVWRHFPLELAHPHALLAAEASEAAAAQGRFWEYHDLLLQNQSHLKPKDLQGYAARLGLDMARYAAEMDDHIYLQRVREHLATGQRNHIRATPSLFLDGALQDISFGMQPLHDRVAAAIRADGG
jgi:protein-disulfide isomerase